MIEIQGAITKKPDGSYLIDQGHGPATYHAHQEATPEAWAAAEAYAKANPDKVQAYQPPGPDLAAEALEYLKKTDWYVIRQAETGKKIPADILTARQAARAAIPDQAGNTI